MDSFTRRNSADEDKKLDAEKITMGGLEIHRERITANGSEDYATGQVDITNTPVIIVAARENRKAVLVINHGTNPVSLGKSDVTYLTGVRLSPQDGAGIVVPTAAALYGIVASGTQRISFLETF